MYKELFINMIMDWVLFSFIESIWFYLCFRYIGNLNKMKWYVIGIMGMGNAVISQLFPPVVYQVVMIIWMSIILKQNNKNKFCFINYLISPIYAFLLLFIIEVGYSIILENIINFDRFSNMNENIIFSSVLLIPTKILEFLIIFIIKSIKGGNSNESSIRSRNKT